MYVKASSTGLSELYSYCRTVDDMTCKPCSSQQPTLVADKTSSSVNQHLINTAVSSHHSFSCTKCDKQPFLVQPPSTVLERQLRATPMVVVPPAHGDGVINDAPVASTSNPMPTWTASNLPEPPAKLGRLRWASFVTSVNRLSFPSASSRSTATSPAATAEDDTNESQAYFRLRHVNLDGSGRSQNSAAESLTWGSRFTRLSRSPIPAAMNSLSAAAAADAEPRPSWMFSRSRPDFDSTSVWLQRRRSNLPPLEPEHKPEPEPLSIVVVDNDLSTGNTQLGDQAEVESTAPGNRRSAGGTQSVSVDDATLSESGMGANSHPGSSSVARSLGRIWTRRIWPALRSFHSQDFADREKERLYQAEAWQSSKQGALWGGLFFLFTWLCYCAFMTTRLWLYWVSIVDVWFNFKGHTR